MDYSLPFQNTTYLPSNNYLKGSCCLVFYLGLGVTNIGNHALNIPTKETLTPKTEYVTSICSSSNHGVTQLQTKIDLPKKYKPKTRFAKQLIALRESSINEGMPLLDAEEIILEIKRRRGELE